MKKKVGGALNQRYKSTPPRNSPALELQKMGEEAGGIQVNGMQFAYEIQNPLFFEFNLDVSPGSRCLLVGSNGSGMML